MSDRAAVLVAIAAVLGAARAAAVARPFVLALVALAVLALAWWARRSAAPPAGAVDRRERAAVAAIIVAVAVWTSAGAAVALAALRRGPTGTYTGRVELVGDPVPTPFGARVDLRIEGRRVEASVDATGTRRLLGMLTGERVDVRGRYAPRPVDAPWLDARHIAARFRIDELGASRGTAPPYAVANAVRRVLARGAASLPSEQRALYTGLVFGDDREQPALLADDFRAGGLGHLLAVSGQNVAFALAAAAPVLRRVSWRARWPATGAVLVLFVLVTRAEPSVLRAAMMAAVAARAATLGRVSSGVRSLALAVTMLLCVDPLLVRALGFQLSVVASLGILVGSRPIAARLRGPDALREAVGVTLAAELAVAPLSVWAFGGVPVASVPANLLALPAAGVVMVWGLTGGVVAGVFGPVAAGVVHLPTRLLLWWITEIAGLAGRAPLGTAGARHVVAFAIATALRCATGRAPARSTRRVAARGAATVLVVVTLASCVVAVRRPPPGAGELAPDVWVWRAGAVVVELGSAPVATSTLRALREAGVVSVDVLVVRGGGRRAAAVARDLRARYEPPIVWAPTRHVVRGASTPAPGTVVRTGRLVVRVDESGTRVGVSVHAV